MDPQKLKQASDPKALGTYLAPLAASLSHAHGHGSMESVRSSEVNGHKIVVTTTYRFEVDGRSLQVPLVVTNDGHVQCHALPNYDFLSALRLVEQLVTRFPEEFSAPPSGGGTPTPPHHDHDH